MKVLGNADGLEFKNVFHMSILWLPAHVQHLPAVFPNALFGLTGLFFTDNQFEQISGEYLDLFNNKRYSNISIYSFPIQSIRNYFNNIFISETF